MKIEMEFQPCIPFHPLITLRLSHNLSNHNDSRKIPKWVNVAKALCFSFVFSLENNTELYSKQSFTFEAVLLVINRAMIRA